METTLVNIRMEKNLKNNLEQLCKELGMNMTTAFTIFAKKMCRENRIPFDVSIDTPNKTNIEAIENVRNNTNLSKSFSSVKALMEDLNADD